MMSSDINNITIISVKGDDNHCMISKKSISKIEPTTITLTI